MIGYADSVLTIMNSITEHNIAYIERRWNNKNRNNDMRPRLYENFSRFVC